MDPALEETRDRVRHRLLGARHRDGHWEGALSSSALSTATAVTALALADAERHGALIRGGLAWLDDHANADGGWGDTVLSPSNISTTALVWAAFGLAGRPAPAAEAWLARHAGGTEPATLARAIVARYGKDRTFSVPILTACALAGRLGGDAWGHVAALPFELAVLPPALFRWLNLPVVSYALPALIAIGRVRHHHRPPRNPFVNLLRRSAATASLRVLERIQPCGGGFLEAVPLTAFVTMSLAGMGLANHAVVGKAVRFLAATARHDGSWPIDVNLSTWVTTLSINALARNADFARILPTAERRKVHHWLLAQQHRQRHPYTDARPGGWAWTNLSGGVPDADDTAGALLALRHLAPGDSAASEAAALGTEWLLNLQNRDGGIPTFCKGWGALPFDRSSPDLTAHALRAFAAWRNDLAPALQARIDAAAQRALAFLKDTRRPDGSWLPLWFGNADAPDEENPTYGTACVLAALRDGGLPRSQDMQDTAVRWLLDAQNRDGTWGGAIRTRPSIEETALAVSALAGLPDARHAVRRAIQALIDITDRGRHLPASSIGLYFAKLWYFEELYPLIHLTAALEAVRIPRGSEPSSVG